MKAAITKIADSPRIASLFLASLRFVKTAFALASMVISARFFGVGTERDHLVVCLAATTSIPQLLFGPVNEIFRLKYAHLREAEGEVAALQRGNAIMSVAFWILLSTTLTIELFPQIVAKIFAPSFAANGQTDFLLMVRIVMPLLVINQISSGWTYILNAYKVYFVPELVGIATSMLGIAIVLASTRWIGIYSLVVSMYVSASLLMVALLPFVRSKARPALMFWRCDAKLVRPFLKMAMPFYFSFALGQGLVVIEKRIGGSMGTGMISILDYAQKIILIPLAVIMSTITSILAPSLASLFAKRDVDSFRREFIAYLRLTLIALSPMIFLLSCGGHDILSIVFGRKVDSHGLSLMTTTLAWLSMGLVAASVYSLTGQAITAIDKGKHYAVVAAAVQMLIILLNLVFAPGRDIYVLAITWSVAHIAAAAVLLHMLGFGRQIMKALMQIAGVYLLVFGLGSVASLPLHGAHPLLRLPFLAMGAVVGMLLALLAFRIPERTIILGACAKLMEKWRAFGKRADT